MADIESGNTHDGSKVMRTTGICVIMHRAMTNPYTCSALLRYEVPSGVGALFKSLLVKVFAIHWATLRSVQCMTTVHTGNGCHSAMYLWCADQDTTSGDGSPIKMVGTMKPSVTETGRILKSQGETSKTLFA